ncbi:MAG: hypothetical protein ACXW3F_10885 [Pyrinomonadaceae bacterium]
MLDVYGDFPFPNASDEVVIRPMGPDPIVFPGPNPTFRVLHPTSVWRNYLSVRIPQGLPAGEWSLTVRKRGGGPEGTVGRFLIRDTPPYEWEHKSIVSQRELPFRLIAAERNVGPNQASIDLLGYGFGSRQGRFLLFIVTRDQLSQVRNYDRQTTHFVPAQTSFWSDTRIRVEIPVTLRPAEWFLVLSADGRNWSNAISVTPENR